MASVTRAFCRTCVRARVSAVGELFTCLFATSGTDLRPHVRAGATVDELEERLAAVWGVRDDRYSLERARRRRAGEDPGERVEMSYIGG